MPYEHYEYWHPDEYPYEYSNGHSYEHSYRHSEWDHALAEQALSAGVLFVRGSI